MLICSVRMGRHLRGVDTVKQSKGIQGVVSVTVTADVTVAVSSLKPDIKILKSLIYSLIEFIS